MDPAVQGPDEGAGEGCDGEAEVAWSAAQNRRGGSVVGML
jgi:hypothetical protein